MKRKPVKRLLGLMTATLLVNVSVCSHAALVTYEFSAVIRETNNLSGNVQDNLAFLAGWGIEVGALVSGTYTIDTAGDDVNPSDETGRYFDNPLSLSYRVGNVDMAITPPHDGGRYLIINNSDATGDRFLISSSIVPDQAGFRTSYFDLTLRDYSGNIFDSDEIPQVLPDLSELSPYTGLGSGTGILGTFRFGQNGLVGIGAELTMHRVVPIPAAFWFLSSAILAFAGLARRRPR